MAPPSGSDADSLANLLSHTNLDDHEEILKASNATLKTSKNDSNASRAKVVALLNLDRHEDALQFIESRGRDLLDLTRLEHSYALYKCGRLEDAIRIASSGIGRGLKHVEAQAAYRLEQFDRTSNIYSALKEDSTNGDSAGDLRVNQSATEAQLQWADPKNRRTKTKPSRGDLEAFETAFNAACASIARGEIAEASILLQRASDCCKALNDLTDDEKASELLPISAQQLYTFIRLGKEIPPSHLDIDVASISDAASRRIAQNNAVLVDKSPPNPYATHKDFLSNAAIPQASAPFKFQQYILDLNLHVLNLQCFNRTGVFSSTLRTIQNHPTPTILPSINLASVINAAAKAGGESPASQLKSVISLLEQRPNDVGLILTTVQLYIRSGNLTSALSLLENFLLKPEDSQAPAITYSPGLIALLSSIYLKRRQHAHIRNVLRKAALYYETRPEAPLSLLRAAAVELTGSTSETDKELASRLYARLLEADSHDRVAHLGHIAINASTLDPQSSKELQTLPPLARQIGNIDASALEAAGVPKRTPPTESDASATRKRSAPVSSAAQPAKKRVRKSRLPKDYDPSKTPDPERWLPLRERSSYRPKGKKGKAKAAAMTQGGVSNEESLELAGGAGSVKVEKAGQGAKGGKNKKKGRKK